MTLELRISNLAGVELCELRVASDWQGRQLKEAIAGKTQIPLSKQKLMYGTTLIRNTDVLGQILGEGEGEKELLLIRQTVDFDFWLDEISRDYRRLRKAPEELRSDPQVVMEAMNQNPQAIKFAADSVKADSAPGRLDCVYLHCSGAVGRPGDRPAVRTKVPPALQQAISMAETRQRVGQGIAIEQQRLECLRDESRDVGGPRAGVDGCQATFTAGS